MWELVIELKRNKKFNFDGLNMLNQSINRKTKKYWQFVSARPFKWHQSGVDRGWYAEMIYIKVKTAHFAGEKFV